MVRGRVLDKQFSSWTDMFRRVGFQQSADSSCWLKDLQSDRPFDTLWAGSYFCETQQDQPLLQSMTAQRQDPPQVQQTQIMKTWKKKEAAEAVSIRVYDADHGWARQLYTDLCVRWTYVFPLSAPSVTSRTRQTPNLRAASKGPSCVSPRLWSHGTDFTLLPPFITPIKFGTGGHQDLQQVINQRR